MKSARKFIVRNTSLGTWLDRLRRLDLYKFYGVPFLAWILGKEVVYVIHINKTAGTSLVSSIRNLGWKAKKFFIVPLPHNVGIMDVPHHQKIAFFVRNPLTRFASGFEHVKHRGRPAYDYVLTDNEEYVFKHFQSFQELVEATNSPEGRLNELSVFAWSSVVHLRLNYRHYFGDIDYLRRQLDRIVFVGEQEDFAEDWKRFFKKFYGKEVPVEEKNVLAKHREVLPGYREAIERIHPDEFLLYEEVLRRKAQLLEEELRSAEGGS